MTPGPSPAPRESRDPVADGWKLVVMAQLPAELGAELTVLRVDDVIDSVFHGHSRWGEAVLLERPERVGVRRIPAQGLEGPT